MIRYHIQSLLIFFTPTWGKKPNFEKFIFFSNKFFHNFNFLTPRLRVSTKTEYLHFKNKCTKQKQKGHKTNMLLLVYKFIKEKIPGKWKVCLEVHVLGHQSKHSFRKIANENNTLTLQNLWVDLFLKL